MKLAEGEPCEIHTDSEFWINVITKWASGWAAKGWRIICTECLHLHCGMMKNRNYSV
jgi:ribonuclease HI